MPRKLWHLECDLDDGIAHSVMSLIGASSKAFNVKLTPIMQKADDEVPDGTTKKSPTEFITAYLKTTDDKFPTLPLREAAAAAGVSGPASIQVLYRFAKSGLVKRVSDGVFKKTAKGQVHFGTVDREQPAKKAKAKKPAAKKPPEPKSEYAPARGSVADKVIRVLTNHKGPMAVAEIKKSLREEGNGVSVALSGLIERGIIERPEPAHYTMAANA